jgi:hypothetical protein
MTTPSGGANNDSQEALRLVVGSRRLNTPPKRQASGGTSPGPSDACLNAAWHEALDAVFRRVSE